MLVASAILFQRGTGAMGTFLMESPIRKIISGGQTGADQAALYAAKELGIETGGFMPHGFLTEVGYNPELKALFGVQALRSSNYPPRTRKNIEHSDGTLIFGRQNSPGCLLTAKICRETGKSIFYVPWRAEIPLDLQAKENFLLWIFRRKVRTLNVAGNRESTNPGIFQVCKNFLIQAITHPEIKEFRP